MIAATTNSTITSFINKLKKEQKLDMWCKVITKACNEQQCAEETKKRVKQNVIITCEDVVMKCTEKSSGLLTPIRRVDQILVQPL